MKRALHSTLLIGAVSVLAACGGGGGSSAIGTLPSAGSGQPGLTGSATFVVSIPKNGPKAGARHAKYLTPSVQGIDFNVAPNVPNGATPAPPNGRGYVFYALTPQSTYCNTSNPSALVCTLQVQAYPGSDLFTVNTYVPGRSRLSR